MLSSKNINLTNAKVELFSAKLKNLGSQNEITDLTYLAWFDPQGGSNKLTLRTGSILG